MPAAGFGMGMERLLMVMENDGVQFEEPKAVDIYLAATEESTILKAMEIARNLRNEGMKVEVTHIMKSLKAQMKYANKLDCRYVAILWDEYIKDNKVLLKNMDDGNEEKININNLIGEINNVSK